MSEATPEVKGGPPTLAAPPGDALPSGARLAEFEIRSVLGAGGFGIVYLAWDHALEREVALKEYMPASLAGRAPDGRVTVRAASQSDTFALGLRSFVNEARLLARFDHASLVKVYRFFEGNGTAYMAMPMIHGRTLRQVRQAMPEGSPGEAWARKVLEPLLGALDLMHREEIYHRDIAPDNILLTDTGRPVLLDFGAARRVIGDRSHAITAIVKPNFAPIEQYADVASVRQGPWTDLYALAATVYYLLTGMPPLPAAARALHDELMPLARLKPADCSPAFLDAIDWALAVRPKDRPQSLALWRDVLEGRMAVPALVRADMTMPSVAPPSQVKAAVNGAPDFDPTQPWPGRSGRSVTAPPAGLPPLPASVTSPGATAILPNTEPAALDDTQPTLPDVLPAAGLRGRGGWRLSAWALGAAAVALFAGAAWRWSTGPAAGTAPTPLAAASAPAAASGASSVSGGAMAASSAASLPAVALTDGTGPAPGQPVETVLATRPAAPARSVPQAAAPSSQAPVQAQAAAPIVVLPAQPEDTPPSARERPRRTAERTRGSERDDPPPRAAALRAPSDRCAERSFLLRPTCMKNECDSDPRLRHHPECLRMQAAEQERRDVLNR